MGMSFQGPPPPPPSFWREPAFWFTLLFAIACLAGAWFVTVVAVQVAAVLGGSWVVAAYSHLRLSVARERLGQARPLLRRGGG